jgi:hypothetical protein
MARFGLMVLAAFLCFGAPASGAGGSGHRVWTLRVKNDLKEVVTGDFDGDGVADLIVVCGWKSGRRVGRTMGVFLHRPEGGYPASPDRVLKVPPGVAAIDSADVTGGPQDDIVLLAGDGVWAFTDFRRKAGPLLRKICPMRTFFSLAPPNRLVRLSVARDLDGDGRVDLLVPRPDGYAVAFQAPDRSFGRVAVLRVPSEDRVVRHTNPIFETAYAVLKKNLPVLVPANFDGDGRTDLVALSKKSLLVFRQGSKRGFPTTPSLRAVLPFLERPADRAEMDLFESRKVRLHDVNRDGRVDLVYTSTHGKIGLFSSIKTSFALFLGREGTFYAERPNTLLHVPGVALHPDILDYDGDGDHDLLIATVRTDLFGGLKAAVGREVTVTYLLFLCNAAGTWERRPAFAEKVVFPTSMIDKGELALRALFAGDFDGDGLRDKVTVLEEGGLAIYPGRLKEGRYVFASEPAARVAADASADLEVLDLNGDGRSDVLFYHPDRVCVVMSKK